MNDEISELILEYREKIDFTRQKLELYINRNDISGIKKKNKIKKLVNKLNKLQINYHYFITILPNDNIDTQ